MKLPVPTWQHVPWVLFVLVIIGLTWMGLTQYRQYGSAGLITQNREQADHIRRLRNQRMLEIDRVRALEIQVGKLLDALVAMDNALNDSKITE